MPSGDVTDQMKLDALKSALDNGVLNQEEYNTKVIAINNPIEPFSWAKFFTGFFHAFHPVLWAKDLSQMFNVRKLIVYLVIIGALFGFGFFKGKSTKPVVIDSKDFVSDVKIKEGVNAGDTLEVASKGGRLTYQFISKDGTKGNLYTVTEADIPKLKPYGFDFKPKLFLGYGSKGPAIGVGVQVAHVYKLDLDMFLMSDKAVYAGVSYDLASTNTKSWLNNSSVGLAVGKGFSSANDMRVMAYWSVKF